MKRMFSVCRAPIHNLLSLVVNWTRPDSSGKPSSAATARWDTEGTRGISWVFAKLASMKFPAAPESIRAIVSVICPLIFRVTGISNTVEGWRFKLTAVGLRGGWVGQVALLCPDHPQYQHRFWRMSLSLSSSLRWVKPIWVRCQEVVKWCRLEPKKNVSDDESEECYELLWMASSINWSKDLPSPRLASSDCSSGLKPLQKCSLRGSSRQSCLSCECMEWESIISHRTSSLA